MILYRVSDIDSLRQSGDSYLTDQFGEIAEVFAEAREAGIDPWRFVKVEMTVIRDADIEWKEVDAP